MADDPQNVILVTTGGMGGKPQAANAPIATRGWGIASVTTEPILTKIELAMKSTISGLRVVDGYYFNHGTVDQRDLVKATFPAHFIDLEPEELNLDGINSAHSYAYKNRDFFRITTVGKTTTKKAIPIEAIKIILNRALHDLKKAFGKNYYLNNSGAESIMYRGCSREYPKSNDIMKPYRLITVWEVNYTQSRINPTEVAT